MVRCKLYTVPFKSFDPNLNAIQSLAYAANLKKLAVARKDSAIEIWNISEFIYQERLIGSGKKYSVLSVAWCDSRLFSVCLEGHLVEYDLSMACPKKALPVDGGMACCLAVNEEKCQIAVGTEGGYINIVKISKNVVIERVLEKFACRIISIAWDQQNLIVAGSIDSVCVWDVDSGQIVHRLSIDKKENDMVTIMWCVAILDESTFVSGDSRGVLSFWDAKHGVLSESHICHLADILCLDVSKSRDRVFCAGVDPTITVFTEIPRRKGKSTKPSWIKTTAKTVHEMDVTALIICDDKIITGSIDGHIAICEYSFKSVIKTGLFVQASCAAICQKARLLMIRGITHIEIWKIKKFQKPEIIFKLISRSKDRILTVGLSDNGKYLSYATSSETRVFSFASSQNNYSKLRNIEYIPTELKSTQNLIFSRDSIHLVASHGRKFITVCKLAEENMSLLAKISTMAIFNDLIILLQVSDDSKYIVAADVQGNVAIWTLANANLLCQLPKYAFLPTAIGIKNECVSIIHVDRTLTEYDIVQRKASCFPRLIKAEPRRGFCNSSVIRGINYCPKNSNIRIFNDDSKICVYNKRKAPFMSESVGDFGRAVSSTSTCVSAPISWSWSSYNDIPSLKSNTRHPCKSAISIAKKYENNDLMFVGWIGPGELVAVEMDKAEYRKKLPQAFASKKFPF